jgi:hypothetical protein
MTHLKTFLTGAAFISLLAAPVAAWVIPKEAPFITKRDELKKADLTADGVLAFVVHNETGLAITMDFSNEAADKGARVDFSPGFAGSLSASLGPFKVYEKKIAKDVISDSIALYLLPPGTYTSRHLFARAEKEGQRPGRKVESALFTIAAGEITNLGTVTVTAEKKLLSRKVWLSSDSTTTTALEAALRALPDSNLAQMPVRTGHVTVAAE